MKIQKKKKEITVPLKCLRTFWRTLETSLINCKWNLMLNWSTSCVICQVYRTTTLAITDTNVMF